MKTELKVHFYLRKTDEKKNGECPVIGKITIGKDVVQFSAKLTAKASLWDIVSGKVKGKSKHATEINATLDKINVAVNTSYRKLQEIKNTITASEVKNAFQGIASGQETLISYFARHNEDFKKCVGVNRELSTQVQYENFLNHLKRFMSLKCKLSDIPFTQLDFPFIEKYDFYLRVELKLKPNTILGIMRHLRKMIKLATGEGIITRDPFDGYSPERPKAEQKYLTRDELQKIITTPLDHPCRYLTRDMFLFSVFTGLAYRDICNLTEKNIVRAFDGVLWIETTRQKTGTPCEIPLMEIPLQILDKYKRLAPDGKLLPMQSCGRLNKNLKVIAQLCGLKRKLIFHAGRHTYASEICLSQGVPIETVSRMLGHRDLRSTQIYAKISNNKISEDTDKLEERIKDKFRLVGTEQ